MVMLNDIFTPANRLVVSLLRSRAHGLASRGLMVLSWEGRSSGRPFAIPVGYQRDDETFIVLLSKPSEKNWWRNFRQPWPAELLVRGEECSVTGVLVAPGDPAFFDHCERTLKKLPWMGSQLGGVKYDRQLGLSEDQRGVLAAHAAVVRFDPVV